MSVISWFVVVMRLSGGGVTIEEVLIGVTDFDIHLFDADVIKSSDTVYRSSRE